MSDPHTVLVLGAGASVAEAKGFRPKQHRDHPPLDANFFPKVAQHVTGTRLNRVVDHAEELGQPDLCGGSPAVSLEQYLGRLYFEMSNEQTAANVSNYYDLVRLYAAELLTTTNWMIGRRGSIRKVLEKELATGATLSIITFNHDLLAENALAEVSRRFGTRWCMRHAYGFGPGVEKCASPGSEFDGPCPGSAYHVPVYKLHGSVNWVFRTLREYPPADLPRRKRKLLVWTNKTIPPWANKLGGERRPWYLWPLIVPPIYEKHGYIHGELRRVWEAASRDLRTADRVLFWGYSFPRADLHARYFFQGAAQANPALRKPILINPDPHAHAELWEVVRPQAVTHFHDVRDFLA